MFYNMDGVYWDEVPSCQARRGTSSDEASPKRTSRGGDFP